MSTWKTGFWAVAVKNVPGRVVRIQRGSPGGGSVGGGSVGGVEPSQVTEAVSFTDWAASRSGF